MMTTRRNSNPIQHPHTITVGKDIHGFATIGYKSAVDCHVYDNSH